MRIKQFKDFNYHKLDGVLPTRINHVIADWYMGKYTERQDKMMAPFINEMMHQHTCNVPIENLDWLEIETRSRCNRSCAFCATGNKCDPRPDITMNEELFKKIIDDLASFNYSGTIALFCNNEMFMDKNIISRLKYVKEKLPFAWKFTYTNCDLLAPTQLSKTNPVEFKKIIIAKFKEMADLLDCCVLDNYSDNGKLTPQIQAIWDVYKNDYPDFVIWMRRANEVLGTKGGQSPNRKPPAYKQESGCYMPFMHMYIDPLGRVRQCCQDAQWRAPYIGNLKVETIREVWNGEGYKSLRQYFLSGKKRCNLQVCNGCDVFHLGKNREDITQDKYAEKFQIGKRLPKI